MLGLIRQLAKLITLAKNFPKLLSLLPKMFTSLPGLISQASAHGQVEKVNQQNEISKNNLQQQRSDRIERINNDESLTENQKSLRIANINNRYDELDSNLVGQDSVDASTSNVIDDHKSKIEPAIQTAIAPLAMAVGIPSGINYITNLLGSADLDTDLSSYEDVISSRDAEGRFNKDMNAVASEEGEGIFPIGELDRGIYSTIWLVSFEQDPTLRLVNGSVAPIYLQVDDTARVFGKFNFNLSKLSELSNLNISIINYRVIPTTMNSIFKASIDADGFITIEVTEVPTVNMVGSLRFNVTGTRTITFASNLKREFVANNYFEIPVNFKIK